MRLSAFERYLYSAELWTDTSTAPKDDPQYVPIYTNLRPIQINVRFDSTYNFAEIRCEDLLDLGSQLRFIKDREGNLLLGVGFVYQIDGLSPVVNIFGYAEGYRYRVRRLSI